ncbi:MAG: aminotransferase class V-fold PLP-dependent enzyme [Bacteroidota bacterium]
MKRRNVIKGLTLLPVAGSVMLKESWALPATGNTTISAGSLKNAESITTEASFMAEGNIFRSIGVEPVINCMGTYTIIGGSIERPAVREAMEAAAHNFVQYDELADGIGQRLATLTGAEWGMVSAGCAAGLKHITAACVTGGNPEKLIRIPDLTGLEKTEVIIPRYSRNAYDHAVRNIGVTIVHVTTPEELAKAINPKTAMIYLTSGRNSSTGQPLSLEVIAGIAKPKNIPILIDAAAENLTLPPVHLKRGATIVAYSGGKAICGPQCAGLMLGDKALLMSAWQASAPHHGPGRDNKVGREEMIGMMAAVEDWTKRDHDADWKKWMGWLDTIVKRVSVIPGVKTSILEPAGLGNKSPVLTVSWNPETLHTTAFDIAEELGRNKPRVALAAQEETDGVTSVSITTGQMQAGEEKIVADRLYEVLSKKRNPKPAMAAPAANLTGRWDVTVNFFSSTSQHSFNIEQDGNWLSGTHKGDLDTRNLNGTIDGNKIMLRSNIPIVGDTLIFLFSGEASGDTMSGNIHLGEYRTATFTAKRNTAKPARQKVMIPGGPPLAT